MTKTYQQLQKQLSNIRSRWRLYRSVEGVLLVLASLAMLTLTASWLDWVYVFGAGARWCVWLLMVSCLAVVIVLKIARPWLQRYSDAYVATLVESRQPGMDNHLINAVQIGSADAAVAPLLSQAIVTDAITSLGTIRRRVLANGRTLGQCTATAGVACVLLSLFLVLVGPGGFTSMGRVLQPWADIVPFTWTTVEISPTNSVHILQGNPLEVKAQWHGRVPVSCNIHWVTQDGLHRTMPMKAAKPHPALMMHLFESVRQPMVVYATCGDGTSERLNVTVQMRPMVESLTAAITPPAYTALPVITTQLTGSQLSAYAGSNITLTFHANKPLAAATLMIDGQADINLSTAPDNPRQWTGSIKVDAAAQLTIKLLDAQGYKVKDPGVWQISLLGDTTPLVNITKPGRDDYLTADSALDIVINAADDLGLANVKLMAQYQGKDQQPPRVVEEWDMQKPQSQKHKNQKHTTLNTKKTAANFGLKQGQSLQYWAVATDRNTITGPGIASSQRYVVTYLTPKQAQTSASELILNYSQFIGQLLKDQKTNLTAATGHLPAGPLTLRQIDIRHKTLQLIQSMERSRFEGQSIMDELSTLASREMAQVIDHFERARDAAALDAGHRLLDASLSDQKQIIASLESILQRLDRNEAARKKLKVLEQKSPQQHQQVVAALQKISHDLDRFLVEQKQLDQNYEKMPKRANDELQGESALTAQDPKHRIDRWKKWHKGAIDDLAKLPTGFAKDMHLADSINTIFEEIEKKPRQPTVEIATPAEENAKMQGTQLMEDLEMWMMDRGDNLKWVMEDPPEGKFEIPEMTLPDKLQDMVGDLIEDAQAFDEDADDTTGSSGGNLPQAGWAIMDGPISSFSATGKTGNQLPNDSEITGRSGAGRRGKATGQMVGSDSAAMEGRPTPARVTNERYEQGQVQATSQLDPRGSTGGGKKTGGGQEGLQGGTPPDLSKNMARLEKNQAMIREKAQQLADALVIQGRSASQVDRAMLLFEDAQGDMRDKRYQDAARKRKMAVGELRNLKDGAQQAVSLSLDKARSLSPELRQQISAGASQPMPQGYEDMVGAYYRALSEAGSTNESSDTPGKP